MTESGILSVIKRFPLATLILGALFLYSGAAGHWSISQFNVAIDDGAWRVVLGILGTALLAVSVYAYYLENKPPPPKVPNIVQPKEFREVYRVEIISPKPGPIQAPFDVKGTCESLPPTEFKLWLFLLSKSGTEFILSKFLNSNRQRDGSMALAGRQKLPSKDGSQTMRDVFNYTSLAHTEKLWLTTTSVPEKR